MNVQDIIDIKLHRVNPTIEEKYQHKGFLLVFKDNTVKTFELDYGYHLYKDAQLYLEFEDYDSKEDFNDRTNSFECYYNTLTVGKSFKEAGGRIMQTFPDIIEVWMCDI